MKKNQYITLALGAAIAMTGGASIASAQATTLDGIRQERKEWLKDAQGVRKDLRDGAREARTQYKEVRTERKGEASAYRAETKEAAQAARADVKSQLDAASTPEERKAIMEEARTSAKELRGTVKEDRANFRETNKELRGEFIAKAKDRLAARLVHISIRLDGALARFNQLTERVQSYIDKKTEAGLDTAAAQAALDTSETAKDTAKAQVAETKELIKTILASDTPKEEMEGLRASIKESTRAIRAANDAMKDAIIAARALK